MLALIIVYFLVLTALVTLDGVAMIVVGKRQGNFAPCNFLRYIRGLEMLMAIYLITIMELAVCLADTLTIGFVKANTIIFSVVALIYIIDFAYNEYKLRNYVLVISKLPKAAWQRDDVLGNVKYRLEDIYIAKDQLANVQQSLQDEQPRPNFTKRVLKTRLPMIAMLLAAMVACIVLVAVA